MNETNGHVADELRSSYAAHEQRQRDTIADLINELELGIEAEVDGREELAELLRASKERESHMRKALAALQPVPSATTPVRPATAGEKKAAWRPTEERIEFVFDRFREYMATDPEPDKRTKTALFKWMQDVRHDAIAADTVGKCIAILRERELIRVTGAARGGGSFIDLMPNVEAVPDAA